VPRWLQWLERLTLTRDDREFLAGDLEEEYWYARRTYGGGYASRRHVRAVVLASSRRGRTMVARFVNDLRHALRGLSRRRTFAAAGIVTLGLGIGATTAIVSVADAVLLTPLPYPDSARLLFVSSGSPGASAGGDQLSLLDIEDVARRARTLDGVAPYNTGRALELQAGHAGTPERVRANFVGPAYLTLLGAKAARGRLFDARDDAAVNAHPVVIVTHEFWQRRLGADPGIIGRVLSFSDVPLTVVGVLEASFRDVSAEEGYAFASDVFVPVTMTPSFGGATYLTDRTARNFWALARIASGATLRQAKADVAAIGELLQREQPRANRGFTFWAERLDVYLARDIRGPIVLLLAGSLFVRLIGFSNVANLLLAHASARARELAIRRALGASRIQIVALLFAESVTLAAGGGAIGLALAAQGPSAFRLIVPGAIGPRLEHARLDGLALGCAIALTAGASIVLACVAAWRLSREESIAALRDGSRSLTGPPASSTRRLLLVAEVAAAVVLVIAAWLMLGSLSRLRATGLGFRTERLITLEMNLGSGRYPDNAAVAQFGRELVTTLRSTFGVESALIWGPARPGRNTWVTFPGREETPPGAERMMAWRHTVNPGALRDIGIPLLRGRDFTAFDNANTSPVVIVSDTLARTLWPGDDAVGKRLKWRTDVASSPLLTVVGVAADAKHRGRLNDLLYPARDVYLPHAQRADRMIVAVVRAATEPESVVRSVRAAVAGLDPQLPLFNVTTMAEQMAEEEAETRFAAVLMTTFGAVAMLLAAVGIYGVLSYHVTQRTREMAVRLALGASRGSVLQMVVADSMRPVGFGIAVGLAAAAAVTRYLASLLYQVRPRDPATFAWVAAILGAIALAATLLPAMRATRVSPIEALREE
jgi:putative ABC transport system permease protein